MKKIGAILSGCGIHGNSRAHEAVSTLLAISRSNTQAVCSASDKQQVGVVDHLTGEAMTEAYSVLIEAVRITRGEVRPLARADAIGLDTSIVPGGFSMARNLSNFAGPGSKCTTDRELEALAQVMRQAGEPLGFMCTALVVLPGVFDFPLYSTIGADIDTTRVLEEMGVGHVPCPVDGVTVDGDNKIVIIPAYMLTQNIAEAASDIDKLVSRILVLIEQAKAA